MSTDQNLTVNCPTCGKSILWNSDAPYRPFCCHRCRMLDLGDWVTEGHRIPGEPADGLAGPPDAVTGSGSDTLF